MNEDYIRREHERIQREWRQAYVDDDRIPPGQQSGEDEEEVKVERRNQVFEE
jgi:hypothetical protein